MKRRWVWIAVAAMLIVLPTVAAARPTGSHLRRLVPGKAILDYRFPARLARTGRAASPAGVNLVPRPRSKDGTKKFTYVLVGKNPAKKLATPHGHHDRPGPRFGRPVERGHFRSDRDRRMRHGVPGDHAAWHSRRCSPQGTTSGEARRSDRSSISTRSDALSSGSTRRSTGVNPGYHVNLDADDVRSAIDRGRSRTPPRRRRAGSPCGELTGRDRDQRWDDYLHDDAATVAGRGPASTRRPSRSSSSATW